MKDIDFDELDRAVNSLINPSTDQSDTVTSQTPTESSAVTVTSVTPLPSSPSISSVTPPSVVSLAQRRSSGRFMDVVHPSSDMRSSSASVRPKLVEPVTVSSTSQATEPEKELAKTVSTTWPDPIDLQETAKVSEPQSNPLQEMPTNTSETNGPLESPFLADAQVEKRPLGAFSGDMHESDPSAALTPLDMNLTSEEPSSTTGDEPRLSDHPIETDTPLPAELQAGLLSIESSEDPVGHKTDSSFGMAESTSTAKPMISTGPTSIAKQYTEQPSTGDKPVGTIFDTAAYKKPQVHSGKKKSGWLVVVWILLLLAVGAGVGAAVYFFVLPRL
jgi:hypothetical protein